MELTNTPIRVNVEIYYNGELQKIEDRNYNEKDLNSWNQALELCYNAVERELPMIMREVYGMDIKTKIIYPPHKGSIIFSFELFIFSLGILKESYNTISNLPNFIEGINFIKTSLKWILLRALKRKFKNDFDVNVIVADPSLRKPEEKSNREFSDSSQLSVPYNILQSQTPEWANKLFYYLIAQNIVLVLFIIVLAYNAVIKMYFT